MAYFTSKYGINILTYLSLFAIISRGFGDDFEIKMSIGTALYNGEADINELLNNADKKLYEAKKTSKNI